MPWSRHLLMIPWCESQSAARENHILLFQLTSGMGHPLCSQWRKQARHAPCAVNPTGSGLGGFICFNSSLVQPGQQPSERKGEGGFLSLARCGKGDSCEGWGVSLFPVKQQSCCVWKPGSSSHRISSHGASAPVGRGEGKHTLAHTHSHTGKVFHS